MRRLSAFLLLGVGCATSPQPYTAAQDALVGRGPWPKVPSVEMPTGDTTVPISLLRDVADALAPASYKDTPIEMASALVAERQDSTRIILRYFPTGEIQQWSDARAGWVSLGVCAPSATTSRDRTPQCKEPPRLLRE
jgi:hypothetical protein